MALIDKIVEVKNQAYISLREQCPCLHKVLMRYFTNKRFGCQVLDEQSKVLEEFTLILSKENVMRYEPGIKNPWFTMGVKKSFIEEQFKDIEKYLEHPLSTALLNYLPKYPLYLLRGDVKFGRTKK